MLAVELEPGREHLNLGKGKEEGGVERQWIKRKITTTTTTKILRKSFTSDDIISTVVEQLLPKFFVICSGT